MTKELETTIDALRTNSGRYSKFERYYAGSHELSFATEKFANAFGSQFREFAMNLCPAVCDAVKDKLKVAGFAAGPEVISPDADEIWSRSRMRLRSGEVHKEVLKKGDAYAMVWPDDEGRAAIYPHRAESVAVRYDIERPGRILSAAKFWRTDGGLTRLNIYYPDRIDRFTTERTADSYLPDASDFVPLGSPVANPFGTVPIFHFANNADVGKPGRSELEDAIPIQDGLNKSVLDMLVTMEFSAFRQRWAAGIEVEIDAEGKAVAPFTSGIDHLWVAQDPNARFGDFQTAALDQFLKVKDSFRIDIASVTGTPLHYLMPHMRGHPSGETLRRSETRFLAKVRDRQEAFGQVWADLMEFALKIEHGESGVRLRTTWEDPSSAD